MRGKIIKLLDLGFIEYDIDKRISFKRGSEIDVNIGDIVEFEIILTKINNSETTYEQAKIIKVISKNKTINKQHLRLSKAARKLDIGISTLTNILYQYGFEIYPNLNTKITEEQFKILEKHLLTKKEVEKTEISNEFERGTVIETQIEKIIKPSIIVLSFTSEKKALI